MGGGGLLSYDTLVLAASGAAVGIFALVQKIHKAKTFCIGPKNLQCKHILCIDPIKNLLGRNIFRFPKYLCIVHLLNIHNCNFVILHCGKQNYSSLYHIFYEDKNLPQSHYKHNKKQTRKFPYWMFSITGYHSCCTVHTYVEIQNSNLPQKGSCCASLLTMPLTTAFTRFPFIICHENAIYDANDARMTIILKSFVYSPLLRCFSSSLLLIDESASSCQKDHPRSLFFPTGYNWRTV